MKNYVVFLSFIFWPLLIRG